MAKGKELNMKIPSVGDLFSTQEEREEVGRESVRDIPLEDIHEFPNHPFKVKDDTLYVVVSKGNKVLTMNEANKIVRDNNFINDEKIVVNIKGEVLNVQSALSLKCENENVDVKAAGSVHCQNIGGNAACGGSIHCNDIGQNAASGGSLHARKVNGKASAGGSVKIGNID